MTEISNRELARRLNELANIIEDEEPAGFVNGDILDLRLAAKRLDPPELPEPSRASHMSS